MRPHRQLYVQAVQLYREALVAEPGLPGGHRYNAACAAVLAADGRGKDEGKLDEKDRANLRQQAHEWLRDELAERKKVAEANPKARLALQDFLKHLQNDPDLNSVRDEAAPPKLPSLEQAAWRRLWANVADMLRSEKKSPVERP